MKNLLYTAGIVGSLLVGGIAYNANAQTGSVDPLDSSTRGNIPVEEVSVYATTKSEYGKTVTEDFMRNNPQKLQVEKLTRGELELHFLDVAVQYKKKLEQYGNVKPDYEVIKAKNVQLIESNKTLTDKLNKKTKDLRACLSGEDPDKPSKDKK